MTSPDTLVGPWADARAPARDAAVFRHQLERQARERPDQVFVRFEDGPTWTFADALEIARKSASGLKALGVQSGDPVLIWMPTQPEFTAIMFGVHYLGAVMASPNIAYKGGVLQHLLQLTGAKVAAIHAKLLGRLKDIDIAGMETIIVVGDMPAESGLSARLVPAAQVLSAPVDPMVRDIIVEPWDLQYIIYTSGTTGASKGVMVTYIQMHAHCERLLCEWYGPGDAWLVQLPMFHLSGTIPYAAALAYGAGLIMAKPFRLATFWPTVAKFKPTFAIILSGMAALLLGQKSGLDDKTNSLKRVMTVPVFPDADAFAQRFGVEVSTWYGSSEVPVPIQAPWNPRDTRSAGHLHEGFEARIVDEHDADVAEGEVGELILRARRSFTITQGYWHDAEASLKFWRNGWAHTGDAFRRIGQEYYFVDRKKDAIRRRGENISSFEVERDVSAHPAILECAAIGIANPLGEEDVMILVVRKDGAELSALELFEFLRGRMAHFMLPRYIRFVESFPKTETGRAQKFILREQGVTNETWDREAHGIVVKRETI